MMTIYKSGTVKATVRAGALLMLSFALAACSANHHSIHRVTNMAGKGPVVVTVDAKQRAIIGNYRQYRGRGDGNGEQTRRFCSEPSPDAFSVIAQAFSGGGSFGQTADPKAIEAALNFSASSSESGATIARTQTTNTLRELMFRTCERYMNGAIDELEMANQAARDQRLIVSILAIEQLTGAVTPPTVVINTNGGATAGAGSDAIVALDAARQQRDTTAATAAAAQKSYDETNGTDKICEANPVADADKPKCTDASGKLASAKAAAAKAADDHQSLNSLARGGGVSVMTGSQSSGGSDGMMASPQAVVTVAGTVEEIVKANISDRSDILLFCFKSFDPVYEPIAALAASSPTDAATLRSTCTDYIKAVVDADRERVLDLMRQSRVEGGIVTQYDDYFDRFWAAVAANDRLDAALLRALATKKGVSDADLTRLGRAVFTAGMNRAAARAAFAGLDVGAATKLGTE